MSYAANIPKFYLYRALRFPLLWLPVYVIFFQEARGLTLAQIGVIDAVFWLTTALGEVPTGVVADRYGRKNSMLIGTVLYTLAVGIVAVADAYAIILMAYVLWGIALTLTSGADEALLYESLRLDGRAKEYESVAARAEAITQMAKAVGSIVGGLLMAITLALPFTMSAVLGVLTVLVILSFKEPQAEAGTERPSYSAILRDTWRLLQTRPIVAWALLYLAVVPLGPYMILMVYIQPYALQVGIPLVGLGALVMCMNLLGMLGVTLAPKFARRYGNRRVLLVIPPLLTMGLLSLAWLHHWPGLLLIGGVSLLAAMIRPLVMAIIHREVGDQVRATIISVQSLVYTFLLAIFSPLYGALADQNGVNTVFAVMGMVLMFSVIIMVMQQRLRPLARNPQTR